jgi:hypothetical protein
MPRKIIVHDVFSPVGYASLFDVKIPNTTIVNLRYSPNSIVNVIFVRGGTTYICCSIFISV